MQMQYIAYEKLLDQVQQNHIDVQAVINSFLWRPRTLWPGLNMMWNHGATGIQRAGIREMPVSQGLKERETLRATDF